MPRILALSVVLTIGILCSAVSANAIYNGDFELGNCTGWTPYSEGGSSAQGGYTQTGNVHSGTYAYYMHHNGQANTTRKIYQNFSVAGMEDPVLDFWWMAENNVGWYNFFAVGAWSWVDIRLPDNGAVLYEVARNGGNTLNTHYDTGGWQHYTVHLNSVTPEDELCLAFYLRTSNDQGRPNHCWFDDIQVYDAAGPAVPEPATMLGLLAAGLATKRYLRRRSPLIG